jgi:hypothetical protein
MTSTSWRVVRVWGVVGQVPDLAGFAIDLPLIGTLVGPWLAPAWPPSSSLVHPVGSALATLIQHHNQGRGIGPTHEEHSTSGSTVATELQKPGSAQQ